LETSHGGVRPWAEPPVEAADSQAVAPQQELEDADVVAAHAAADDPPSEQRSAAPAQGGARARSDQAVDREVMPPLEGTDRAERLRPLNAIDASSVEAVLAQCDLDAGDLRVHRARRRGEREGCKCERACQK
jgi:hypothetical protein